MIIGANVHFTFEFLGNSIQTWALINADDRLSDLKVLAPSISQNEIDSFTNRFLNKNIFESLSSDSQSWINWQTFLINEIRRNYSGNTTIEDEHICLCFGTNFQDVEKYKQEHPNDWEKNIRQELLIGAGCGSCSNYFEQYFTDSKKSAMICFCHEVYEDEVKQALGRHGFNMQKITSETGAGGSCGRCVQDIKKIFLTMNPSRYKGQARAQWLLDVDKLLKEFTLNYPLDLSQVELSRIENNQIFLKGLTQNTDDVIYHFQDYVQSNLDSDFIVFFELENQNKISTKL